MASLIWVVATNAGFQSYCKENGINPDDRSVIQRVNLMVIARYVQPEIGDVLIHVASSEAGDGDPQVYNHILQKAVFT